MKPKIIKKIKLPLPTTGNESGEESEIQEAVSHHIKMVRENLAKAKEKANKNPQLLENLGSETL